LEIYLTIYKSISLNLIIFGVLVDTTKIS